MIDEATNVRICSHMNDDHAVTIHAMVRASLSGREAQRKITNPKMKSVSEKGYTLSYVLCDGDLCEMRTTDVPFQPPLASADEIRPRLIQDHHKALEPKFGWIIKEPLILAIIVICVAMGLATHALGSEKLSALIESFPKIESTVSAVFGSPSTFATLVAKAWYFSVVAHGAEAVYVAYQCRVTLKTTPVAAFKWFILTCCAGFPVTRKATELFEVASKGGKKKS